MLRLLILIAVLAAGCNLAAAPPTPDLSADPTLIGPTLANPLETVGVADLEPSGAGPCILTATTALPIHDAPGDDTAVIATFGENLSESAFLNNAGWYAISWYRGEDEIIGWVDARYVTANGECDTLPDA